MSDLTCEKLFKIYDAVVWWSKWVNMWRNVGYQYEYDTRAPDDWDASGDSDWGASDDDNWEPSGTAC